MARVIGRRAERYQNVILYPKVRVQKLVPGRPEGRPYHYTRIVIGDRNADLALRVTG